MAAFRKMENIESRSRRIKRIVIIFFFYITVTVTGCAGQHVNSPDTKLLMLDISSYTRTEYQRFSCLSVKMLLVPLIKCTQHKLNLL